MTLRYTLFAPICLAAFLAATITEKSFADSCLDNNSAMADELFKALPNRIQPLIKDKSAILKEPAKGSFKTTLEQRLQRWFDATHNHLNTTVTRMTDWEIARSIDIHISTHILAGRPIPGFGGPLNPKNQAEVLQLLADNINNPTKVSNPLRNIIGNSTPYFQLYKLGHSDGTLSRFFRDADTLRTYEVGYRFGVLLTEMQSRIARGVWKAFPNDGLAATFDQFAHTGRLESFQTDPNTIDFRRL